MSPGKLRTMLLGVGVERKRKEGEELQSDFTSRSHSLAQIHDAGTCISFSLFFVSFFFFFSLENILQSKQAVPFGLNFKV